MPFLTGFASLNVLSSVSTIIPPYISTAPSPYLAGRRSSLPCSCLRRSLISLSIASLSRLRYPCITTMFDGCSPKYRQSSRSSSSRNSSSSSRYSPTVFSAKLPECISSYSGHPGSAWIVPVKIRYGVSYLIT